MKRLQLPDLLKGLAAFFMVQIHITELFIDTAGRESVLGKISLFLGGPFAAVIFMVVMGYFISKNKGTTSQNILRGLTIFILGFILNIGLNFHLLLKIYFEAWAYNPLEYLFGIDILYLAGMSIVILALLKSLRKRQQLITALLLLAVAVLNEFSNNSLTITNHYYLLPFIGGNYSWSYFPLFPWLAYPLTGFIFAQHESKIKLFAERQKIISTLLIVAVGITVILFFNQGFETTINLPAYYHHTFTYILWALGISLLWILFLQLFLKLFPDTKLGDFFCWIGKNITLFYIIQWLIIGNIATKLYQNQTIGQYWYWLAGIFITSVVLTFLTKKAWTLLSRPFKKQKMAGIESEI